MWIVPVAVVALVVGSLVVWFVRWQKQWGPQRRVLKHGVAGEAKVLDRNELDTATTGGGQMGVRRIQYKGSLVLEVRREGQAPYKAKCVQWFEKSSWSFVGEGANVYVRIDRDDPQCVFVDTEAKLREMMAANDDERARHAKRQDELMKS